MRLTAALLALAAALLALVSARVSPPYTPPRTTPFQQSLHQRVDAAAAVASAAARGPLLELLAAPRFRAALSSCCPSIATETPAELLARFEAEFMLAELTHNFNTNATGKPR